MTREDIDRIATEYLNDTESTFEMQDVIELADKALILEKAIENIKAEIKKSGRQFDAWRYDMVEVSTVLEIINKHIGESEEMKNVQIVSFGVSGVITEKIKPIIAKMKSRNTMIGKETIGTDANNLNGVRI